MTDQTDKTATPLDDKMPSATHTPEEIEAILAEVGKHEPNAPKTEQEAQAFLASKRIFVGFLAPGMTDSILMHSKFLGELFKLLEGMRFKKWLGYFQRTVPHVGHNRLVKMARSVDATHLLILDDDTTFIPPGTLMRCLLWDKDVITPFTYNRGAPYLPNCMRVFDRPREVWNKPNVRDYGIKFVEPNTGLQPCGLVPTQFLLVKMDVFAKIGFPWFHYPIKGGLQDTYFCAKAAQHGIQVWCDTDRILQHDGIDQKTRMAKLMEPHLQELGRMYLSPEFEQRTVGYDGPPPGKESLGTGMICQWPEGVAESLTVGEFVDYTFGEPVMPQDVAAMDSLLKMKEAGLPLPDLSLRKTLGVVNPFGDDDAETHVAQAARVTEVQDPLAGGVASLNIGAGGTPGKQE